MGFVCAGFRRRAKVSLLCGEGIFHNTTFESSREGCVFVIEVGGPPNTCIHTIKPRRSRFMKPSRAHKA